MNALQPGSTIGILGGGQLGRMLAMSAARYGLKIHIFDPAKDAPAAEIAASHTCASYTDGNALASFAKACQVVTFEFENIPKASLEQLAGAVPLRPGLASLETSQDRLTEKQFLERLGLNVASYAAIDGSDAIERAHTALGGDTVLKTRRFGYDGKGQTRLQAANIDAQQAWEAIGAAPAVLEARIAFVAEVSAIIARDVDGNAVAYDVPVNIHKDGILDTSCVGQFSAFNVTPDLARQAQEAAVKVVDALEHVGVLTVEFFVTEQGNLLINEIAPRVHNSGHWTMDACLHDQFDNHIRAVAGWPLGAPERHSDAVMTNLIGADVEELASHAARRDTQIHLYGKADVRKGRKMGHITRIAPRT